jgi:hypothetical protein
MAVLPSSAAVSLRYALRSNCLRRDPPVLGILTVLTALGRPLLKFEFVLILY